MSFGLGSFVGPGISLGAAMAFPSGANMASFIGTSTWATVPTSASVGDILLVSDIGPTPGAYMTWTGVRWKPIAPVTLLNQVTEVTKTDADVLWQTCATISLPAGLIGTGMSLQGYIVMSGPGNRDLRATWGGQNILVQSIGSGTADFRAILDAQATSTTSVNGWWNGAAGVVGQQGASYTTATVDHSVAQTVVIEMRYNTAGAGSQTITMRPLKVVLQP